MTAIGLVSDVHAAPRPLREALAIFSARQVSHIWCAGDIAGYGNALEETVAVLVESGCKSIRGNHEVWRLEDEGADPDVHRYFSALPFARTATIDGVRVYMVHASPPDSYTEGIRLLDERGEILPEQQLVWSQKLANFAYDVLVVGHTHQVFAERLGSALVINPGSTLLNHSCAILTLPEKTVEVFPLSGRKLIKSWNWGMLVAGGKPAAT